MVKKERNYRRQRGTALPPGVPNLGSRRPVKAAKLDALAPTRTFGQGIFGTVGVDEAGSTGLGRRHPYGIKYDSLLLARWI